ncbi:DUF885 domain-containing protein [Scleromatobacter humisilvae]|uniref:DUF885 domain-containing protein n=1 Tax=Scleromatobacter humisilvae TaxID=2897159 RepID=A0A9X1YIM1_9BURK|nr:DUF885 domain-containing protein [Scleromatobacter humisilvae]MCK9686412.1 DUF885 domain-containing protein [Scleromatobacter humisilvae]
MKIALSIVVAVLSSPAWAAPGFDAWAEGVAAQRMRANPVLATVFQYFNGEEQAALDGRFAPITKIAILANVARERKELEELHGFDPKALTPVQKVSAGVIGWSLEQDIATADYLDDDFVFNQMGGLQVELVNFMTQQQPLRNARDVQSYLERLAGLAELMDQGVARARGAEAQGVLMPRFITTKTISQFEYFLAPAAARNVLVTAMDDRMAHIEGLSAEKREAARAKAEKIVADSVLPAWRRGLALMQEQLPRTNDDAGVWRLKGGDKYYAAQLRRMTTTDDTPAEIHAIGLAQVTRIEGEMDGLLKQLGYVEGSVKDRYARMDADRQPKAADPRPELLARYTSILRDAEVRAKLVFDVQPTAAVEVRREPPLTEATAAAHYTLPAPDGSRPGIFWAPLPGPTFAISEMRTLVYHEAVPGHHFQIAIQQETHELPPYRRSRVFSSGSAFTEGWALYAEQLAAENGWYDGDPAGRLGQLSDALFRARRLVVDTGLHSMKWTRQQAIDYGISPTEVDRYVVWPGQACSYMIGRLTIESLRDKARVALGDKFDIRKFHDIVLLTGNVPLKVLEGVVNDWIRAQAA